jgi:hypothetical protein
MSPIVTIDPKEYERFELKTAPPDGFVMLRPLPYGMKLSRRSKATRMMMRQSGTTTKGQPQGEQVFEVESMDEWAVAFDFAYCIGEHNLQNADGTLIDFAKNTYMKIRMLDPKVGTEIEQLIDNLNNAEDEESMEDFLKRQDTLSLDTNPSSETDGNESSTEPNLQNA